MHILYDAYNACYSPPCEAQKRSFTGSATVPEQTPAVMARAERFGGFGAQTLHPAQLPGLRPRGQASQLPAGLYAEGKAPLLVCARGYGSGAQARLGERPPDRALAL